MIKISKPKPWLWLGAALFASTTHNVSATPLDQMIDEKLGEHEKAVRSQARVDRLSDEADDLLARFRAVEEQRASIDVYNGQLQEMVAAQEAELASLQRQIATATNVGREVTPLLARMLDALDDFVALDAPFLQNERRARIRSLREMMVRADVTTSEKFRRVLEAYQIENEYGRTIEAYRGAIGDAEDRRTVSFLRLGRVALFYHTLDGREAAQWDRHAQTWAPLDAEYRRALKKGMRIARKQAAPDLIRLPVPAPQRGNRP